MTKNKGNKVNKGNKANGQNTFGLTFEKIELTSKRASKWNYDKLADILTIIAKEQGQGNHEVKPVDKFVRLFSKQDNLTGGQARSITYRLHKDGKVKNVKIAVIDNDGNEIIGKEYGRVVICVS